MHQNDNCILLCFQHEVECDEEGHGVGEPGGEDGVQRAAGAEDACYAGEDVVEGEEADGFADADEWVCADAGDGEGDGEADDDEADGGGGEDHVAADEVGEGGGVFVRWEALGDGLEFADGEVYYFFIEYGEGFGAVLKGFEAEVGKGEGADGVCGGGVEGDLASVGKDPVFAGVVEVAFGSEVACEFVAVGGELVGLDAVGAACFGAEAVEVPELVGLLVVEGEVVL